MLKHMNGCLAAYDEIRVRIAYEQANTTQTCIRDISRDRGGSRISEKGVGVGGGGGLLMNND